VELEDELDNGLWNSKAMEEWLAIEIVEDDPIGV
jgi:hypothetical protein